MSSIINALAGGAGGLLTSGDTSGVLEIQTGGTTAITVNASQNVTMSSGLTVTGNNVVNGNTTITGNTAVTGTLTVGGVLVGSGPVFSVYRNAARNANQNAWAAVIPDTEEFDSASCYDTTTGRYTPTVAGYYQINGQVAVGGSNGEIIAAIYKNGAAYKNGNRAPSGAASSNVSSIVYFNGTTDYVELYIFYTGSLTSLATGSTTQNFMNGVFIRPT
jgi:hypothetical protein